MKQPGRPYKTMGTRVSTQTSEGEVTARHKGKTGLDTCVGTTFRIYMHSCLSLHSCSNFKPTKNKQKNYLCDRRNHVSYIDLNVAISYVIHVVLYFALIMNCCSCSHVSRLVYNRCFYFQVTMISGGCEPPSPFPWTKFPQFHWVFQ